jgi:hypothetical protein
MACFLSVASHTVRGTGGVLSHSVARAGKERAAAVGFLGPWKRSSGMNRGGYCGSSEWAIVAPRAS